MLKHLTIRQRILITFISIALTGGLVQFMIAGLQIGSATLEFYRHHLETDALLVATTLSEPLEHSISERNPLSLTRLMNALQAQVGHNYLIVDRNYRVVGYTPDTGYDQVDYASETHELAEAKVERIGADIRANWLGETTLYVAVAISYDNRVTGYIVLSEPMQPAYNEVTQRYLELAAATLPVLGLVVVASLWISGTISRPVQNLRNSALLMAKGDLSTRIQITSRDELGQLADSFNDMAHHLETLMKTQRSFVSNAAHELRTPLMTLKLRAEALSEENLPAVERDTYLREIRQEVDHMARLVSSLLMLARIDEGRHPQNGTTVTDTVATLNDLVRHWRIEAEDKGVQFSAQIDPDLPELPMSPNDLRLVLDNLLSNALKYTTAGSIRLIVSYQAHEFQLTVQDTGIGFSPQQGEHLFERFYRSEDVRGRYVGNGLGLSIVKAILDYYGGRIEAQSPGQGQGSTFILRLSSEVRPEPA